MTPPANVTSGERIMSDDSVTTIHGTFATREAADRAVEHLVQEHGVPRADVFVRPAAAANYAGDAPSGGDAGRGEAEGSAFAARLDGSIEVSADLSRQKLAVAERAFREAGARDVVTR